MRLVSCMAFNSLLPRMIYAVVTALTLEQIMLTLPDCLDFMVWPASAYIPRIATLRWWQALNDLLAIFKTSYNQHTFDYLIDRSILERLRQGITCLATTSMQQTACVL